MNGSGGGRLFRGLFHLTSNVKLGNIFITALKKISKTDDKRSWWYQYKKKRFIVGLKLD